MTYIYLFIMLSYFPGFPSPLLIAHLKSWLAAILCSNGEANQGLDPESSMSLDLLSV